jgi:hypothetical protein
MKHPVEFLCHAYAYMKFWSGLYKTDFQEQLAAGVDVILAAA